MVSACHLSLYLHWNMIGAYFTGETSQPIIDTGHKTWMNHLSIHLFFLWKQFCVAISCLQLGFKLPQLPNSITGQVIHFSWQWIAGWIDLRICVKFLHQCGWYVVQLRFCEHSFLAHCYDRSSLREVSFFFLFYFIFPFSEVHVGWQGSNSFGGYNWTK